MMHKGKKPMKKEKTMSRPMKMHKEATMDDIMKRMKKVYGKKA